MRRLLWTLIPIAVIAAALPALTWRPFVVADASPSDAERRVSGVLHVHTEFSDGHGSAEEVIEAAAVAGLDYLIITDHNRLDAKRLEGYHGRLLVIVGTEISTRQGHLLAFGIPDPTFRFSDDASEVMEDIQHFGGVAVIAHPDSPRERFRWTQWDLPGPTGLEILNGDTEWRSLGSLGTVRLFATYPLNKTKALLHALRRPDVTLARWDQLLQQRSMPIVVGSDAHGLPSYEAVFEMAQNHLLLDRPLSRDAAEATTAVVSALRRGSGYAGIDGLAPAGGFSFVAEQDGRQWTMGETVPASPRPMLRAGGGLPDGATVFLFRDGRLVKETSGQLDWPNAEPGVYRVEARLPGWDVPWILSNPIYVFDAAESEVRQQRERMPSPEVPTAAELLDDFNAPTVFTTASDVSTRLEQPMVVPEAGPDGSASARMQFTLGTPSRAIPSPFAALVSLEDRDLTGRKGLVFSIRSDRPYRVWVQVRDENRLSEEGTEWWYASVRSAPEWRRVAVPFERMRTRDEHSDGRLNLDRSRGVLFIVDIGAVPPGTAGTIWIDDVGVY